MAAIDAALLAKPCQGSIGIAGTIVLLERAVGKFDGAYFPDAAGREAVEHQSGVAVVRKVRTPHLMARGKLALVVISAPTAMQNDNGGMRTLPRGGEQKAGQRPGRCREARRWNIDLLGAIGVGSPDGCNEEQ